MRLTIGLTAGHPRLNIVFLHLRNAQIPSTDDDHTIGETQRLQEFLGILQDVLVLLGRDGWIIDTQHDLFDFLKLVDAIEPARIFAVSAVPSAPGAAGV